MISRGQMGQFIECLDLMLSNMLLLHLYDPMASSEPALTSPGWMERRIWHFHYSAHGHSPIQLTNSPVTCPQHSRENINYTATRGSTSSAVYRKHQHRAWN